MVCEHPETNIAAASDGVKEETCEECGETVAEHRVSHVCGGELPDGGTCERSVTGSDERCWQHGENE